MTEILATEFEACTIGDSEAMEALFSPLKLRDLTLKNRVTIPPMCQYSAQDGVPNDWHFVHLGKFAMGGYGLITVEATAVEKSARITHGDLGIWSDDHIGPMSRIVEFIHSQNAKASLQLAHASRKAGMQRPWHGNSHMTQADIDRGEVPWPVVGVTDQPVGEGWQVPTPLEKEDIDSILASFVAAAKRAVRAGFDAVEIHGAHGYLIHTFLSPLTNTRTDEYGGDFEGRTKLAREIVSAVRSAIPDHMPLFFKISSIDWEESGWQLEESIKLASILKELGVDIVVCSSGGLSGAATASGQTRSLGYQVQYSEAVRGGSTAKTQAVGLLIDGPMAGRVIAAGSADLVGIGRQSLFDPFWPVHELNRVKAAGLDEWEKWPNQYGWWLSRRENLVLNLTKSTT
jgi:2,4-dienoyl-CoA reductase-like NADH-dependent reductase (Old Yellow Enzyme family)